MSHQDRIDYGSIAEIQDHPEPTNPSNLDYWKLVTSPSYQCKDWWGPGMTTLDQVYDYAKNGWGYGANKVEKLVSSISLPVLESIRRKLIRSDTGDMLDPHAINSGRFDKAWTSKRRTSTRGPKRYQLCCQIGGNCGVTGTELMWRGVACLALAKAIIKAGHAVEIIAFANVKSCYTDGTGLIATVKVKPFESYLDISSLAVALGLSGFYRVHMWKARLCSDKQIKSGLGSSNPELPKIESGTATQIQIPGYIDTQYRVEDFLTSIVDKL